jgi:glycosyltransferase involved in cell wall biosynthesis
VQVYSEPDKGIYDAMNKGLRYATGKYLIWINADDVLAGPTVLLEIFNQLMPNHDVLCGSVEIVDNDGVVKRFWNSKICIYFGGRLFLQAPHPGFVVKRKVLQENSIFYNPKLKIASDMDLMLKLFNTGIIFQYSDTVVARMLIGGTSTNGIGSTWIGWKESISVFWKYYSILALPFLILRTFSKYFYRK